MSSFSSSFPIPPSKSPLLQRLEQFLPQIKKANEETVKHIKLQDNVSIDADLVEQNDDNACGDDVDSCDESSGIENPSVQINLALGEIDDKILEALEGVDSAVPAVDSATPETKLEIVLPVKSAQEGFEMNPVSSTRKVINKSL